MDKLRTCNLLIVIIIILIYIYWNFYPEIFNNICSIFNIHITERFLENNLFKYRMNPRYDIKYW